MDYIDYSGEDTSTGTGLWTYKAFRKHFNDLYWLCHKVGGTIPWTMKEEKLLSKMMKEFSKEDLADMMEYWHSTQPASVAYLVPSIIKELASIIR